MKKIIKKGKIKFYTCCPLCRCEFTYVLDDMIGFTVECPYCNYQVNHSKSIPAIAKEMEKCVDEAYYSLF